MVKITCRDGRQLDRAAVRPAGGAHDRDLVICLIDIPRQRFIGKVVGPVRTPAIIIAIIKGKDDRISAFFHVDGRRRAARRYHGTFVWRRILCPDSFTRIGVMFLRQFGQFHPLAGDGEVVLLKFFVRAGICKRHIGIVRHARHFHIYRVAAGKGRNVCTGRRLTPLRIGVGIRLLRTAVGRARKGDFDGRPRGRGKGNGRVFVYARDQLDLCGQIRFFTICPAAAEGKFRAHQFRLLNDDGVGDRPRSGVHARPAVTSALQGEGNGIGAHVCQCDGIGLCSDDLAAVKAVVALLGHLRDLGNRRIDIGK